jgi:3-dehydroquinate dehydratase-1/3-dehydroquinate dehydratase/shikimate dehydrogenase
MMITKQKICVSIAAKELDKALSVAQDAAVQADVIEIRLDALTDIQLEPFFAAIDKPLLFTNRPLWEGGNYQGDEKERLLPLLQAVELGAGYVDLELQATASSHTIMQKKIAAASSKLIISWHSFQDTPESSTLLQLLHKMQDMGADIGKLITTAHDERDVLRILSLQEEAAYMKMPLIAFCMGDAGIISRVATTYLGGYMTYCAANTQTATAPGQLSINNMHTIYKMINNDY